MDKRKMRKPIGYNVVTERTNNVVTNQLDPSIPSKTIPGLKPKNKFDFFATIVKE